MDLLSNVPLALFQGFLLFLISKIILDIKYTLRDYLIILTIIIPSAFFLLLFRKYFCFIFINWLWSFPIL